MLTLFAAVFIIAGWGGTGHKKISRKSTLSFPAVMSPFLFWSDSLAVHGSDADYRKSSDTTESRRHYIDLDAYAEFTANGRISQTLDSLYAIHGWYFVKSKGIVPFAVIAYTDSVRKYFLQRDFRKAMLKAADLGHYVADMHNPLHVTQYYDGRYPTASGIHSRYETTLINRDSAQIIYGGETVTHISGINDYVFNKLYYNYAYVDSVFRADSLAYIASGGSFNNTYYLNLWEQSKYFTILMFKNASKMLAELIYTAWVDAGSPIPVWVNNNTSHTADNFELSQNFPNPFNPDTYIKYHIPGGRGTTFVSLKVYDMLGKEISALVNGEQKPGNYVIRFNAGTDVNSGTYFYRLTTDSYSETKRMVVLK